MHNPSFDSILNELNAVLPKLRHYEIENFISEYYIILTSRNEIPFKKCVSIKRRLRVNFHKYSITGSIFSGASYLYPKTKKHFTIKIFFEKIQDTAQKNQFRAEKVNSVSKKSKYR